MNTVQKTVSIATLLFSSMLARSEVATVIAGASLADRYLGLNGGQLSGDPVLQSYTKAEFDNGAYAKVCFSKSLKGSWNDGSLGNEVDYGIGWSGTVSGKVSLNVSATYWDEPRAGTFGKGDILYLKAVCTRSFKNFSVFTTHEQFVPMRGSGFRGGSLTGLGGSISRSFGGTWSMHASATALYDIGTFGNKAGLLLRGNAGLDRTLTRRLTLNLIAVDWYAPERRAMRSMTYTGVTWGWAK